MNPATTSSPVAPAQPSRRLGWAVGLGLGLVALAVIGVIAINPAGPIANSVAVSDSTQLDAAAPPAPDYNPYQGGIRRTLTITTRTQTDSLAALLGIPVDSILDPGQHFEPVGAMVGSWPTQRINVLVRDTFRIRAGMTLARLTDSLNIPETRLRAVNQLASDAEVTQGKVFLVPYTSNPQAEQWVAQFIQDLNNQTATFFTDHYTDTLQQWFTLRNVPLQTAIQKGFDWFGRYYETSAIEWNTLLVKPLPNGGYETVFKLDYQRLNREDGNTIHNRVRITMRFRPDGKVYYIK